jgi:hypothetical protein
MRLEHARLIAMLVVITVGSSLASEAMAVTKAWVGSGGGGDGVSWSDANNWSPAGAPAAADDVVLDNSSVGGSYTVNLPGAAVTTTIVRLTMTPSSGAITLVLPAANTGQPGFRVGDAVAGTDDIILNSGAVLRNQTGATAGNGIEANSTANGTVRINNGGRYVHNTVRSTGGVVPLMSAAAGTEKGTFEYDIPGTGTQSIGASGRTYGNLVLTRSGGPATYNSTGASALTVRNNFIVNAGVTYSSGMTGAMNIGGSIQNSGAPLSLPAGPATQPVNFNGTSLQTTTGSVTLTTASSVAATAQLAVGSGFGNTGAMTVAGTLQIDASALPGGSGSYAYAAATGSLGINASIGIGEPDDERAANRERQVPNADRCRRWQSAHPERPVPDRGQRRVHGVSHLRAGFDTLL